MDKSDAGSCLVADSGRVLVLIIYLKHVFSKSSVIGRAVV